MNYSEQRQFFKRSRMLAAALAVLLTAVAGACAAVLGTLTRSSSIAFALTVLALAISLVYTPNYLHLTVNPQKRPRWQIKIRWRLAGLVVVVGLFLVPRGAGDIVVVAAAAWLVCAYLLAARIVPAQSFSSYFWVTDCVLLSILLAAMQIDLATGAALLAASAHLSVVICEKSTLGWAGVVVA